MGFKKEAYQSERLMRDDLQKCGWVRENQQWMVKPPTVGTHSLPSVWKEQEEGALPHLRESSRDFHLKDPINLQWLEREDARGGNTLVLSSRPALIFHQDLPLAQLSTESLVDAVPRAQPPEAEGRVEKVRANNVIQQNG